MNLDAVGNCVTDFNLGPIRRLHNLQSGRFEHRDVHYQRTQVVDVDIITNEFESTGHGQGLVIESMDPQSEKSRRRRTDTESHRAIHVALRRDSHEIIRIGREPISGQRKSKVAEAVADEGVNVLFVRRITFVGQ